MPGSRISTSKDSGGDGARTAADGPRRPTLRQLPRRQATSSKFPCTKPISSRALCRARTWGPLWSYHASNSGRKEVLSLARRRSKPVHVAVPSLHQGSSCCLHQEIPSSGISRSWTEAAHIPHQSRWGIHLHRVHGVLLQHRCDSTPHCYMSSAWMNQRRSPKPSNINVGGERCWRR